MRLLQFNGRDSFSLADGCEEVTFEDLKGVITRSKAGYEKLRFCAIQAASDGLQYFWVDTCCIDKSSLVELQHAINSMFRWYQNAARCYVYLSDVDTTEDDQFSQTSWEAAFRESRWFTRGWTLQELIAPTSVEFFSRSHIRLGDKKSLEQQIHETTGIPIAALQGSPLSHFTVEERMSWVEHRQTKYEEDKVYSLQGIFDVYIPLIYGEGWDRALFRLQREIQESSKVAAMSYVSLTDLMNARSRHAIS
ncbi:heterokaryon incompatibility protein-domain-containing protein [Leptodontidium sp. 2 PMI_412]|nr:heterokaryon incompatibility protein-domain-containing protein [Leptodontidium sp. 2 PMI_412]